MPYILPKSAGNPLYPYGQTVSFSLQGVTPPASEYISPQDSIALRLDCPIAGATVRLGLRLLSTKGEVVPTLKTYDVSATGSAGQTNQIQQSEGFLLSAVVEAAGCQRGQCFARLYIQRNQGGDVPIPGEMLVQGYVCDTESLTFPHGTIASSLSGGGFVKGVPIGSPGVGGSASVTVPDGVRWRVQGVTYTATVGTIRPTLLVNVSATDPTGNLVFASSNLVEQPASSGSGSYFVSFVAGGGGLGLAPANSGLPTSPQLPAGSVITASTEDFGGGTISLDQGSVGVEEFVEV